MTSQADPEPLRVLILGGGVAGVEALLGLHELAGDRVDVTLLSESRELHYRPLAVGEPFGGEHAQRFALAELADDNGARFVHGVAHHVDVEGHLVKTLTGEALPYDVLIVTLGAVPYLPWGHALAFDVTTDRMLSRTLSRVRRGEVRRLVVALPAGPHWTLPGYELALLLAHAEAPADFEIVLVTGERRPLEDFGRDATEAVTAELAAAEVRLVCNTRITLSGSTPTTVAMTPTGETYDADLVIALPSLHAPTIGGLPTLASGFLRVDDHGRVSGAPDVYAAGDCTDYPIKQGGLAAQQADVVVEHLAVRVGATAELDPPAHILRARMLTGSEDLWLRRDLGDLADTGTVAHHALWWPPGKIAGRWLAPYVAARADGDAGVPHPPAHGHVVDRIGHAADVPVPRHLDLLGDPTRRPNGR
jgi:sulfide:quinone oxidoreductase